jgi:subtilisin-like proprotein convertase family protein
LVASLLALAHLVGGPVAPAWAAEPVAMRRMAPQIAAELAAGAERFSVIVHVTAPPQAHLPLAASPGLADRRRQDAVAAVLDSELRDLVKRLSPDERATLRPFLLQPAFAVTLSRGGLLDLLERPAVLAIEADLRFMAHTAEGLQMIGATGLHELGWAGEGTAVAIVDTGIDPLHPTLGGVPLPNAKVVRGLDTADLDSDPTDCNGHGTAVASIAAGTSYQWSPQLRFAGGVAPQARILAYKASPDADCGAFPLSAVVAAIEDALLHRVGDGYQLAAINLSFGGGAFAGPCDGFATSYANAVAAAAEAGVIIVASSGNDGASGAIAAPSCVGEVLSVASVWDTESGWVGYAFCLDPECESRCDDSFRPTGAVTCYSNSSPVLDLLAPSEYLRAARANGQNIEFGGTSGAAAYATGAVALLRQAGSQLEPGAVRQLLKLSGDPTLDTRSGLVRPRINLERALAAAGRVHASTAPGAAIQPGGTAPMVSTVDVDQPGVIGSVRVMLEVIHPAPERLEIALIAPSGTRARLHHHGPGTIPAAGAALHHDGVWGLYPDELDPVDSLAVFAGQLAAGSWHLELVDAGPEVPGAELARLVGWALSIEEAEPPAAPTATTTVVPVVAHIHGAEGALWRSDVRIFNPSPDTTATARLYFVPSSADGTQTFWQSELVLPQQTVLDLPDVVARRFAGAAPRGSLILQTTAPGLVVSSRTSTGDAESGSYGQFIGSVSASQLTQLGDPPVVIGELGTGDDVRTNLGLTEVAGASATVSVVRFDGATGAPVAAPTLFTVAPYSNLQVGLVQHPGSAPGYAKVTVTAGAGRITAYASLVDNHTGDAVFIPAVQPPVIDRLLIPVVARQSGRGGTRWRSSLQLVNLGPAAATLDLRLRQRQGGPPQPAAATATLDPGRALAIEDVVEELFGLDQAVGSLEISLPGGEAPIVATSRTFNATPDGSYGQGVPAVAAGVGPRAVITHVDGAGSQRANVGVCEVAGLSARVRATILDARGRQLGEPLTLEPGPFELVQVDDVFAAAGADPIPNCRIELEQLSGGGEFVGYASVVDGVTGDAIFVPAVAQPE